MNLLATVAALSVATTLILLSVAISNRWILGPLNRLAEVRRQPAQFTLLDFFCLFVLVQLGLAVILGRSAIPETPERVVIGTGVLTFSALGWWAGVRVLSQAGIRSASHRAFFLLVVFPVTILVAVGLPFGAAAVVVMVLAVTLGAPSSAVPLSWALGASVLLSIALALCRRYVLWLARSHSPPPPSTTPPGDEDCA